MNRQKLILFLLLIVFAGAVVYAVAKSPRQQTVAKLKYVPGAVASAPRATAGAAKGAASNQAPAAASSVPPAATPAAPAAPATLGTPSPATAPANAGTATGAAGSGAPAGAPAGVAGAAAARVPGAGPQIANDESRVHLELLEQGSRFSGYRRNLFSPIYRDEVKGAPIRTLPPLPPKPSNLPPPPQPLTPPAAAQPAPPPGPTPEQLADQELAKFTFLGFLKKNGDRTVFLSKNNEILLAKKGAKLGPNFVVSDITDDAITIRSVAEGRELVIPLVENRGLSARRNAK